MAMALQPSRQGMEREESEEEAEGAVRRDEKLVGSFYSRRQVHGCLGAATRERGRKHAIGGKIGAASSHEWGLKFWDGGVRGKGLGQARGGRSPLRTQGARQCADGMMGHRR